MLRIILTGLLFIFTVVHHVQSDYYMSSTGLDRLMEMEVLMVDHLENYIQAVQQRNKNLRNYIGYVNHEMGKAKNNSLNYFGNPINAWKAIKRVTRDWRDFYFADMNNKSLEELIESMGTLETRIGSRKPVLNDLLGAARAIARLQRTYDIKTSDLANGLIMGYELSTELSASDCYDLGMSLIYSNDTKNGATWLLESRSRLARETQEAVKRGLFNFPFLRDDMILESLVPAVMKNGNTKLALWLIKEQLSEFPNNLNALESFNVATEQLKNERWKIWRGDVRPLEEPLTITKMYEKTCSGELSQTPEEQRNLRCRYSHNNVPFCFIAPFKVEELNLDPLIALYHEAIYDNEIDNIIEKAKVKMEHSNVDDIVSEDRSFKSSWLPIHENAYLTPIRQRLTDITGLDLESSKEFHVSDYGIGGHYKPQYDFLEVNKVDYSRNGNRLLSALFYISDVELGGATVFPYLSLAIPPIKGSLVIWYNLHRSLEPDYRTIHAGCPVLKGFKWSFNVGYHTLGHELIQPCDLINDDYKSFEYNDLSDKDI